MTNREKLIEDLKSMSIEDLARFLKQYGEGCEYCIYRDRESCDDKYIDCFGGIKSFLEQEVSDSQ